MSNSIFLSAMSTKDSEKSTGSLDSDSSIRSFYSAHSQISLFEYEQGPSSHPQRSPQRHNKARGGISTSQPSVENRQELPSQPWNVEEPTRTGLDTQPVRQRSVQVTKEPEAMDAPSQEMVDALAMYVITVSLVMCLTRFSQVPWASKTPKRAQGV